MLNKQCVCVCVKLKPDNKITCFSDYSIYFKVFPKSSAIKSRGRQPLKHEVNHDVQGCPSLHCFMDYSCTISSCFTVFCIVYTDVMFVVLRVMWKNVHLSLIMSF